MNNFQRLMEEEEQNSPQAPLHIQSNVEGTLGMFRFIGQIVEVYLPMFSGMLVNLVGGKEGVDVANGRRPLPHDVPNTPNDGPQLNSDNNGRG